MCQASIAGSWPLTAIPAGTSCWCLPAACPPSSPAVFMLHGASGDGGLFLRISGWREKATQENFVAIFPTAVEHFVLETQRFSTRWNNYDLPTEIDPNRRPAGYPVDFSLARR